MLEEQILIVTKIIAPKLDMSTHLEDGDIDVGHLDPKDIIMDKTNDFKGSFIKIPTPVTLFVKHFKICTALAVSTKISFKEDVITFIKMNKRLLLHQVLYNTINKCYLVRYFDVRLNLLDWWITKIMFKRAKYISNSR